MADGNDSPENKPSSLEIISRVWSSLTSNEEPQESTDATNKNDDIKQDLENDSPEPSDVNENEEITNEQPRRGLIFSSIFSSFGSDNSETDPEPDKSSDIDDSGSSNEENNGTEDLSAQELDRVSSENATENDEEDTGSPRQGSLAIISNFLSNFTSAPTTETVEDEVQTAEQNQNVDVAESESKPDESEIPSDSNTNTDVEDQDRINTRLRSSSSALYTKPEQIDKKDLDYVTLVSS